MLLLVRHHLLYAPFPRYPLTRKRHLESEKRVEEMRAMMREDAVERLGVEVDDIEKVRVFVLYRYIYFVRILLTHTS